MKLSLYFPVSPVHLNQGFGLNGAYYQANGINIVGHNGLDLMAYHGQPIYAAHDGDAFYEEDDSAGHGVVIVSTEKFDAPAGFDVEGNPTQCNFKSIYWHMCDPNKEPRYASPIYKAVGNRVNSGVSVPVKVGDLIGYADSTGLSSGDHLHFGLKPIVQGVAPRSGDAPDVGIGNWVDLYPNNGYFGAIDPTPYLNGYYAPQANQVLSLLQQLSAALQAYVQILVVKVAQHSAATTTPVTPNSAPTATISPKTPTMSNASQFPAMIQKWAAAIAVGEGADPMSHNPGNLKYSPLTASWGAQAGCSATDGGNLCQFPDDQTGLNALCSFLILGAQNQLKAFHQARTLEAFTKIYAGNPPQGYIDGIAQKLGVSETVDISTFLA